MADELSAPLLGRKARKRAGRRGGWSFPLARVSFLLILVVVGALALRIMVVDDPDGGRPAAEVPIASSRDGNALATALTGAAPDAPVTITAEPEQTIVPVEGGPSFTTIADESIAANSMIVLDRSGVVPDLAEETANGPIPRIAGDGRTPFTTYSKPPPPDAAASGATMVAIVVTGLGLNEDGTLDAVERLPPAVTLAFAPYGRSLERTTGAARAAGHELFLEVPFEPFDYPDNDPGPETLLTGQPPRANLEKLYWLLGRFGGYAGIINYMGARFTASTADFAPVMEEIAARGLGYLDDGSSNRSLAAQLATSNAVPFGRADLMLDGNPSRAAILARLGDLETRAVASGGAIGIVSALPVSVETVAEWAAGLDERGFVLVPASALMGRT